jgi:hypothetical protein
MQQTGVSAQSDGLARFENEGLQDLSVQELVKPVKFEEGETATAKNKSRNAA